MSKDIICAYCEKPIKGDAYYDQENKCFIHNQLPTAVDEILGICIGLENIPNPFELLEHKFAGQPEDCRPTCTALYVLLQIKNEKLINLSLEYIR
jgi:hypothetical protein